VFVAVATPTIETGNAFCTTSTRICRLAPSPTPMTPM